jgi:hypothetical protein
MSIDGIIDYILANPNIYPGKHNHPTERTNPSQPALEPKSQMQIIWRALITYLDNNLRQGKSVNMKKFGAFTFDIETDLPRIARRQISADSDIGRERSERKHIHKLRPCFVVDPVLKRLLNRYKGKEEISPAGSQKSIFQQGFKMIYANPVPVASACQMGVDVVRSTLDIIYKAIEDLINIHDKDIQLQFGFAAVSMR